MNGENGHELDEPEPRKDLCAHLREQVEAGTYETEGKLKIAAEKLQKELDA